MNQTPKLQWHPAFCAALQIELEGEDLEFSFEHNLTRKPLQIDALVIHKHPEVTIQKSIGKIFRMHNILEFKSPEDTLSIQDYSKVLAYACIYHANQEHVHDVSLGDITITFVGNHYPRAMINELQKQYEKDLFLVEPAYPGIYYLRGLPFPTQLVITKELSSEELVWLSRLRSDLTAEQDRDILLHAYKGKDQIPRYSTLMDILVRANQTCFKEDNEMCDALMELMEQPIRERENKAMQDGWNQGLSKGRCTLLIEQICRKITFHKSISDIADDLAVSFEEIEPIYNIAKDFAPDYPVEQIYEKLIASR